MRTNQETLPATTAPPTGRELTAALRRMLRAQIPDLDRVLTDLGQIEAAERRAAGREFTLREHVRGLLLSRLSKEPIDLFANVPTVGDGRVRMRINNSGREEDVQFNEDGTEVHRVTYSGSQTGVAVAF